MIIELGYLDMFWVGVTVGWILCWYVPVLLNIQVHSNRLNQVKPNYLKPVEFNYQPTNYFKHVPVKEFKYKEPNHSGGVIKEQGNNESIPKRPYKTEKPPLPEYNPNK